MNLHTRRAKLALEIKKYNEVIKEASLAIAQNADDSDAFFFLGQALVHTGKKEEGLKAIDTAISKDPNWWGYHYMKSFFLERDKKHKEALNACNEAIKCDPDRAIPYIAKCNTLRSLKKRDEAYDYLQKALELDPDYHWILRNAGDFYLGHQDKEAESFYRKSLVIHPENPTALNNLGCSLINQGKYRESLECFTETLRIDPMQELAKYNIRYAMRKTIGGLSTSSILWFLLEKLGDPAYVLFFIVLLAPFLWPVLLPIFAIFSLYHLKKRKQQIALYQEDDPEILNLYRSIEQDYATGRLKD